MITVILLLFIFLELFSIYKIATMATFELKQTIFTYELGQEVSQNIDDYVICPDRIKKSLTLNLNRVNLNKVGNYNASIEYAGRDYDFKIKIVDTKKPTVKLKKLVYYVNPNQPLYAKNTVAEVDDAFSLSHSKALSRLGISVATIVESYKFFPAPLFNLLT